MTTRMTLTALTAAVVVALAMGCTPDVDEPVDAAEVANPASVPDPVDPIDAEEPAYGPDTTVGTAAGLAGWDSNSDGMLDEAEFRARFATDEWFADWDEDVDGMLSEEEFEAIHGEWADAPAGVDDDGLFDVWDANDDGLLDDEEIVEGVYVTWDVDRNKQLDNNEFMAGNAWFGTGY